MKNKKTIFIITLLLSCFYSWSQNHNVRIEGQIVGYDGKSELNYGLSSINSIPNNCTVQPDSLGYFKILLTIKDLKFFHLYYSNENIMHRCKLIVQPNNNYSFISKGQKSNSLNHYSPDIYSQKTKIEDGYHFASMDFGQMYYNLIDNGTSGALFHDDWDLMKPESLIDTMQQRINVANSKFFELLEAGKIDTEFYEIAKLNVKYLQAYRLSQTISDTWQLELFKIQDSLIINKLNEVYPKIFKLYPVKGVQMEKIFSFDKYVDQYLTFKADYKDGVFTPTKKKGSSYTKALEGAEEVLTPGAYKYYKLRNTMSYTASLDLRSIKPAKDFLKENPDIQNSPSGQFLEDILIPRTEDFVKLSEKEFSEDIHILDNEKPIESFQELLDILKGKPFIIDYWGTWCAPCRYQFKYNETLKPFLVENGINMVYIAYEYDFNRKKWENFIKAFNLTGYHFISNEKFKSNLEEYTGKISGFPTYIIIDSNGKVLISKAYYPSDGENLYLQLKEELRK